METDHSKKLKMHKRLSLLTIFIGLLLVTFMIVVESEPGALPLALILIGTGWYFITRSKLRSQQI
ncbi:MAG TPA: hypothetical protein VFM80_07715 [Gracilimonas sp.]|uniref:hypothetical protein n=1 Tax=Gracilimonas sp. TaxID=1974203 RepID=UPI002D8FF6DF|nr:hypothetical protein [Gracilimonas sp.]